jgi:hypothetical protein
MSINALLVFQADFSQFPGKAGVVIDIDIGFKNIDADPFIGFLRRQG